MRKEFIFILLLINLTQINGQYIPTLSECNKWEVRRFEGMGSFSDYLYVIKGESLFEDKIYKKAELLTGEIIGYVREDTLGQKIYKWDSNFQNESLIIDYSMEIGDTINVNNFLHVCDSISYDYLYDKVRKVIHFTVDEKFIEGIGYSFYGVANYNGTYQFIIDFEEDSDICLTSTTVLISDEIEIKLFPNPVINEMIVLSNKKLSENIYLINSKGQKVRSLKNPKGETLKIDMRNLPKGIYYLYFEGQGIKKIIKQ